MFERLAIQAIDRAKCQVLEVDILAGGDGFSRRAKHLLEMQTLSGVDHVEACVRAKLVHALIDRGNIGRAVTKTFI